MMNTEVWEEFAEMRRALKQVARESREARAAQEAEIAALRAQVEMMAKALAELTRALAVAA